MKIVKFLVLFCCFFLLIGCIPPKVNPVRRPVTKPAAKNKSLVVFIRPNIGDTRTAAIFDGNKFIGMLTTGTQLAYQTKPGRHFFMVMGAIADFMQANLLPNKTYYVQVHLKLGLFKQTFVFKPQNGQIPRNVLAGWLADSTQVELNREGYRWYRNNRANIAARRNKYLVLWKKSKNKAVLKAGSGV